MHDNVGFAIYELIFRTFEKLQTGFLAVAEERKKLLFIFDFTKPLLLISLQCFTDFILLAKINTNDKRYFFISVPFQFLIATQFCKGFIH